MQTLNLTERQVELLSVAIVSYTRRNEVDETDKTALAEVFVDLTILKEGEDSLRFSKKDAVEQMKQLISLTQRAHGL